MAQVVGKDMVEAPLDGWRLESTYCCTLGAPEAELSEDTGHAERHLHIAAVQQCGPGQRLPVQLRPLVACSKLQLVAAVAFPEQVIDSRNSI